MHREISQIVHATEHLPLGEENLQKLNQDYSLLVSPWPGRGSQYLSEPDLRYWTSFHGVQLGGWFLGHFCNIEEATWGCQRAARLPFFPTPPSHLLFKSARKQSPTGEGGRYLQSKPGGRSVNEEFNIAAVSPTVPRAVGERSERSLKLRGKKRKRITPGPCGFTPFFNWWKIWPIMSWTPVRLQPRGPNCPPLPSRCLPVMEMVNILMHF